MIIYIFEIMERQIIKFYEFEELNIIIILFVVFISFSIHSCPLTHSFCAHWILPKSQASYLLGLGAGRGDSHMNGIRNEKIRLDTNLGGVQASFYL